MRRRSLRRSLPIIGLWLLCVGWLVLQLRLGVSEGPLTAGPKPSSTASGQTGRQTERKPAGSTTGPAAGRPPRPASLDEAVKTVVNRWREQLGPQAEYGLVVHNLESGEKVSLNGHKNFPTASLYKLFVMLAVYSDVSKGNYSLDTPVALIQDAAAEDEDGSLIIPVGQSMKVRDLLEAMITNSNNTAGLMLLFQVKIPRLRQLVSDLGFKESDLSDSYNYQATPEDLDQFLTRLANKKLLDAQSDQAMLNLMLDQRIRDRIPALLPPGTRVANKTGNLGDVSNDSGLIFLPGGQRLAVTVMVRNFANGPASYRFISEISQAAYNYYS